MVSRAALLLVATLGGCNWVLGLDELHGDDPDAAADAVALDAPLGAWGDASPVANHAVVGLGEEDPFLGPNGLELYTIRRDPVGTTGVDIYVSLRTVGGEWQAPERVTEVDTAVEDSTPRLSLDGLTMYVSSNRSSGVTTDVWVADRDDFTSAWHTPHVLVDPQVNADGFNDRTLTECAGGRRVFASDRRGTVDIFEQVDGVATPIPAASDMAVTESSAFISRDCLTLYFASTALGSFDLYVATRAAVDRPFDTAALVAGLSTPDRHESDPWVSADGRHIFFSVASLADPGGSDVYEATR